MTTVKKIPTIAIPTFGVNGFSSSQVQIGPK